MLKLFVTRAKERLKVEFVTSQEREIVKDVSSGGKSKIKF